MPSTSDTLSDEHPKQEEKEEKGTKRVRDSESDSDEEPKRNQSGGDDEKVKPEGSEEEKDQQEENDDDDKTDEEEDEEEEIGPQPKVKKRKVIPYEKIYLENLPLAEAYERSYMHRDSLRFVVVARNTHFLVTGSIDGHIKFWVKRRVGIEFVKHFRAHLGTIVDHSVNNPLGTLLATISDDKSLKVFDIINFDMINMFKLDFVPKCVQWCYSTITGSGQGQRDPFPVVAVSDAASNKIYTFDATSEGSTPLATLDRIHMAPVARMRLNAPYSTMVSVDMQGMLDYWGTHRSEYRFPSSLVSFESKLDTDLYTMARAKVTPHEIAFSPDGTMMAMICSDRKVRLFKFLTGKLLRVYDESLQSLTQLQQTQQVLPNMEFGRRMATERDLEKSPLFNSQGIAFDDSGYFLIYPTMLGIKILNWYSNKLVKMVGKGENFRPLSVAMHQSIPEQVRNTKNLVTAEMATSHNPTLEAAGHADPTLFTTGFRKNRFYMFTRREPDDTAMGGSEESGGNVTGLERDVFNEKPSREDMISATTETAPVASKFSDQATIHTSLGDIYVKLFAKECPRTVENFITHSRNGYYNGHIFHRVIRQFMIQTGDPTGTGTGGQSIWGGEFEDEIVPTLRHDKPFTLSMANAGPNTNGSQFFITVIPTPWLDGKHTVFGRVTKGMEVVQAIGQVRTHPKTDKPYDDVKIINIHVK